jgi:hypothetical protein
VSFNVQRKVAFEPGLYDSRCRTGLAFASLYSLGFAK